MISWIICKQCIRNDDGVLAVSYERKNMTCKSYHERLFNTDCMGYRNNFRHTISSVLCIKDKYIVRKLVIKMKNGKATGPSSLVSEMVKAAEEVGVCMINDLVNQITLRVIPAEQELLIIVNRYKGNCHPLERG